MFIGHFAAGFAAKKLDKRPSLGTLFIAAQFIDLIWPFLLLAGIEKVKIDPGNTVVTPLNFIYYPFSHSLLGVLIWAAGFAAVYYALKKNRNGALLLGGLVISHWLLDLLTHRPDLPLAPGSQAFFGLGLWNSLAGTIAVEGLLFAAGVFIYLRTTKALNRTGTLALWGLVALLALIYIGNLFGPPPAEVEPIGYIGLAQWLLVAWGYWIDRNRKPVS
jgi:hypothetical protein